LVCIRGIGKAGVCPEARIKDQVLIPRDVIGLVFRHANIQESPIHIRDLCISMSYYVTDSVIRVIKCRVIQAKYIVNGKRIFNRGFIALLGIPKADIVNTRSVAHANEGGGIFLTFVAVNH